jgi:hypothetical protein
MMPVPAPLQGWDEVAIGYEIALEAMNRVAAHYAELIALERHKPVPHALLIDTWTRARERCLLDRARLDPEDGAAVAAARREYGGIVVGLCGAVPEPRPGGRVR